MQVDSRGNGETSVYFAMLENSTNRISRWKLGRDNDHRIGVLNEIKDETKYDTAIGMD